MGWFSDRWDDVKNAGRKVGNFVSDTVDKVADFGTTVAGGVKKVAGAINNSQIGQTVLDLATASGIPIVSQIAGGIQKGAKYAERAADTVLEGAKLAKAGSQALRDGDLQGVKAAYDKGKAVYDEGKNLYNTGQSLRPSSGKFVPPPPPPPPPMKKPAVVRPGRPFKRQY